MIVHNLYVVYEDLKQRHEHHTSHSMLPIAQVRLLENRHGRTQSIV